MNTMYENIILTISEIKSDSNGMIEIFYLPLQYNNQQYGNIDNELIMNNYELVTVSIDDLEGSVKISTIKLLSVML
jgi:hypothetical protein